MIETADKFAGQVYEYIQSLADDRKSYRLCREPLRKLLGTKCVTYRKKYIIVFFESEEEIIVTEFLPSKTVHW
jgi:hypothetical protein